MNNKNSKCISVPLKDGEKVRKYLKDNNLLRNDLIIKKDNKYIYFPIIKELIKKYEEQS